jgi:hypothetical protein
MDPQPSKGGFGMALDLNADPASSARCVKAKPRDLCVLQTAWLFCMIMPKFFTLLTIIPVLHLGFGG